VNVLVSLVPNREDVFRLSARVVPKGKLTAFTPVRWEWDFGDGASQSTTDAYIEHDYLHRPQDQVNTTFLIKVRVHGRDGDVADGRYPLTLRNHYFTQKQVKHIVGLVITLEPRYPEYAADGSVKQTVHVWHHEPTPLKIASVHYTDYTKMGDDLGETSVTPHALLGVDAIPPQGVTFPVELSPTDADYVLQRRYVIEGKTDDGLPVFGTFSLMTPPKIDPRTSQRVVDPILKERILAAQQLLGKQQVTEEDMQRLVEQGKLDPYTPPDPREKDAPRSADVQPKPNATPPAAHGATGGK